MFFTPTKFLRAALGADAAASGALGLLCAFGAGQLSTLFGLPESLLRATGIALVVWAAIVAFVATRVMLRPAYVWTIIALNAAWAIDSVGLLFGTEIGPTTLGTVFVIAQAGAVLVLAACELIGLRRTTAARAVTA